MDATRAKQFQLTFKLECFQLLFLVVVVVLLFTQTCAAFDRRDADLNSNMIKSDHCSCPSMAASGPPGIPGVPGLHGSRGQDGNKGDKGDVGSKGDVGPIGPFGLAGPIGPSGERGKKGPEGEKGPVGGQGSKGEKGERGYTGFTGVKGSKGEPWQEKRSKIAFSVMRSQKLGPVLQDTPINFDVIVSNVGDSFEQYSSHFVCKINGTYFFTSHIVGQDSKGILAWMMLNDRQKLPLQVDKRCGHGTGSQTTLMTLKTGDHVWMQLSKDSALLNDFSTFSGFILFED